jgi:AraC-like DNA-binding protein
MTQDSPIPTFAMQQRSERPDFYIRDKLTGRTATHPHRHEYFQIQINLGGDTVQWIGTVQRPFTRRTLAFILPHRVHLIPHPVDGEFVLINFDQHFLLPHLDCAPLDLEDVSIQQAPELSPFRFQEHLDFVLDEGAFGEVLGLVRRMRQHDSSRAFGSREYLKGCLLQLIGTVCQLYAEPLKALAAGNAAQASRRDAMARMSEYVRKHLHDPGLSLSQTAAATAVSPHYLTHWLRKETGKRFNELLLERRMHLARSLLLGGSKPVGEIARLCGFADEAYFSRRFRQAHGLPPGQFRRREEALAQPLG